MLTVFETVLGRTFYVTSPALRSVQEVTLGTLMLFGAGFCFFVIARRCERPKVS